MSASRRVQIVDEVLDDPHRKLLSAAASVRGTAAHAARRLEEVLDDLEETLAGWPA